MSSAARRRERIRLLDTIEHTARAIRADQGTHWERSSRPAIAQLIIDSKKALR